MPDSAAAEEEALAEVVRTCHLLWPGRAVSVDRTRRRRSATGHDLLVIPNAGPPRLLLPARSNRAAATIVSAVNSGVTIEGRLKRAALATAARTGLVDRWAPRRLHIEAPPAGAERTSAIEDELFAITQERLSVTFALGTQRANRKPVLTALDASGRARYFVKIGHNPLTRALVRGEAERLDTVAGASPSTFIAPRCVHLGLWNDLELLVIDALPSSLLQGWRHAQAPCEAMREVAALSGVHDLTLADSEFWRELTTLRGVPESPERDQLTSILAQVGQSWQGEMLRFGSWHGDWTPDNMGRYNKKLLLWDWERLEAGVPWGFDAVHFAFQAARYAGGWTSGRHALEASTPTCLQRLGVPDIHVDLTIVLYLAVITARYLRDRQTVSSDSLDSAIPRLLALLSDRAEAL